MKQTILLWLFAIGCMVLSYKGGVYGEAPAERLKNKDPKEIVFSTWDGFEVDKCASIWLIKRFIYKEATIKFFPKGTFIKEGIAFDTPDAKFRRYHNMSTYESLLRHHKLHDPKLVHIGKIIHDIEVNVWERKVFETSWKVQDAVNRIMTTTADKEAIIRKSSAYFDRLYQSILLQR